MARNQAAKRLFSSLARQGEAAVSGVKSSGQGLLGQRATIVNLTGGAAAAVSGWSAAVTFTLPHQALLAAAPNFKLQQRGA